MNAQRPKVEMLLLGTVDQGKQLELSGDIGGVSQPLVRIFADDADESIWLEVEAGGRLVQLPISVIEEAIKLAHNEVRSESWYEENVY